MQLYQQPLVLQLIAIRNTDMDANAPLTVDVSRSLGPLVRQHTQFHAKIQIQVSYLTA